MISEHYRRLNAELHKRDHAYGTSGSKWAETVLEVAGILGASDILDYGCGKQTLAGMISHRVSCRGYDPAIPHLSAEPPPADLVVCTDVLEHVEPEHLDDVLRHIKSLARRGWFFVISCERGGRKLSDGRFAHLIVKSHDWWEHKLLGSIGGPFVRLPSQSKTQELVGYVGL